MAGEDVRIPEFLEFAAGIEEEIADARTHRRIVGPWPLQHTLPLGDSGFGRFEADDLCDGGAIGGRERQARNEDDPPLWHARHPWLWTSETAMELYSTG